MAITSLSQTTANALANSALKRLASTLSPNLAPSGGGDVMNPDSFAGSLSGNGAYNLGRSLAQSVVGTGGSSGGGSTDYSGGGGSDYSGGYSDGGGSTPYYGSSSGNGGASYVAGPGYSDAVTPSAPTLALTGPAAQFTPVGLDQLIANPEAIMKGIVDPNGTAGNGLYNQVEPYANLSNYLYLADRGQSLDNGAGTKGDTVNWIDNLTRQLTTPGGGTLDWAALANNILHPADGSPLASYEGEGDPGDQSTATGNLLNAVIQAGYNPLIAKAINNRIGEVQTDFLNATAKGAQQPFYQYVLGAVPGGASRLLPGLG